VIISVDGTVTGISVDGTITNDGFPGTGTMLWIGTDVGTKTSGITYGDVGKLNVGGNVIVDNAGTVGTVTTAYVGTVDGKVYSLTITTLGCPGTGTNGIVDWIQIVGT
jgi:hypothetical protein